MSDEPEVIEETSWQHDAGVEGDATFERFGEVSDLTNSYTELRKSYSRSAQFPTEDASDERRTEFRGRVLENDESLMVRPDGYEPAPENADLYIFDDVEGASITPETIASFKAAAHGLHLSPLQAQGVHQYLAKGVASEQTAMTEANEKGMAELKGLYGNALEEKITIAENAVAHLADRVPGVEDMFNSLAAIGQDATGIKLAIAMSEMMGEAGAVQSTHRTKLSPNEASDNLLDLDDKFAGLSEGDRGWDAYQDKRMKLYRAGARTVRPDEGY